MRQILRSVLLSVLLSLGTVRSLLHRVLPALKLTKRNAHKPKPTYCLKNFIFSTQTLTFMLL